MPSRCTCYPLGHGCAYVEVGYDRPDQFGWEPVFRFCRMLSFWLGLGILVYIIDFFFYASSLKSLDSENHVLPR